MSGQRGMSWGPSPLPELLVDQLEAHGFTPDDAPACVRELARTSGSARAVLFVDLGACKFIEGDIDGAVSSWRHAISSVDDVAASGAMLNLGLLYEHLQLHERAISVLRSVSERGVEPQSSQASMALARCQQAQGDAESAMKTMALLAQTTMSHRPESTMLSETFFALGDIAERAGRFDRAERAWRAASAQAASPTHLEAVNRLGSLLLRQGQDEELVLLLNSQSESVEVAAREVLEHAEARFRSGREDLAKSLLALVDVGSLPEPDRFRLADLRVKLGLVNEAIDEFEILLGSGDGQVATQAAFALGEIYRSYDMTDAATSMLEGVVEEGDAYWAPKAALSLGDLLASTGHHDQATRYWNQALGASSVLVADAARARLSAPQPQPEPAPQPAKTGVVQPADSGSDADRSGTMSAAPLPAEALLVEAPSALEAPNSPAAATSAEQVVSPQPGMAEAAKPVEPGMPALATQVEPVEPIVVVLSSLDDTKTDGAKADVASTEGDAGGDEGVDGDLLEVDDDSKLTAVADELANSSPTADAALTAPTRAAETPTVTPAHDEVAADKPAHDEAANDKAANDKAANDKADGDRAPLDKAARDTAPGATNAGDGAAGSGRVVGSFAAASAAPSGTEAALVNPYAALAPRDSLDTDVTPSARNPYAELAPNFETPPRDTEPGDWESMLEDWPQPPIEQEAPKKKPSAFSRHT